MKSLQRRLAFTAYGSGLQLTLRGLAGTRFALLRDVAIDRRTQDSDVMERVLGVDADPSAEDVRTEVIELAVVPWLAGITVSAVQLSVGGIRPRRPRPPRAR